MKHRPCGNGKGDTPRPIKDREKFDSNWDAIFGKKKKPCCADGDDVDCRQGRDCPRRKE